MKAEVTIKVQDFKPFVASLELSYKLARGLIENRGKQPTVGKELYSDAKRLITMIEKIDKYNTNSKI